MREQKSSRKLWHEFTDLELKERGMALSAAVEEKKRVQDAQKDANKGFREELDAIEESIKALAMGIRAHGEQQMTECVVKFHSPKTGRKEIFRVSDGERVAEEAMTPEECQEFLFAEGAGG